ncbi:MAG: GxxExxY protein [bacterium]
MTDTEVMRICDVIRQTSFELHTYLRSGFLEKIYENGLVHRLVLKGVRLEQQKPLKVQDVDGFILGEYVADMFVEDCLIVELKAVSKVCNEHIAQTLGYMRACKVTHGLLINFGASVLEVHKFKL